MNNEWVKEQIIKKYDEHLRTASGGIFSSGARKRLLGKARPYGGRYSQNTLLNFWNRIKTDVANSLMDLALFVEIAPNVKVDEVITPKAIEFLLEAYFQRRFGANAEKRISKAEIADAMINVGFQYLRVTQYPVPGYQDQIIDNALDVSRALTDRLKLNILEKEQETSS